MPTPTIFNQRLAGKVALVTGAGSQGTGFGTGKAIAYLFAREGAKVCLVDQHVERAEETLAMIQEAGCEAFISAGDVTRDEDCLRFVSQTVERYGALHILVNNVGMATGAQGFEQHPIELWHRVMDVNLKSVFLMCRHALPQLTAYPGSAVVNIASTAGLQGNGSVAYGPSKAAMVQLTRELAVMYGRQGLRANTVAPGHIFTPLVDGFVNEDMRLRRQKIAPLNIEGDAWDVAAATLFLASDEARFITGTCLPVDGGVTEVAPLTAYAMVQA
ncbi:glucose 1-dehydrogenase [Pseudomonas sp. CG7]|uniref:SDR family NAD(P)-dependent oxidoreductase n=1 Tax=Pseudomonas sp. CG7 TaxID=191007 RepID=UPI002034262A|nr:glucose 1-dehydrogenase [Pseudomonas sp. CG7]MCM2459398.1 glucose 1-dehydrogenase [Pseudomonas sp. CG7]